MHSRHTLWFWMVLWFGACGGDKQPSQLSSPGTTAGAAATGGAAASAGSQAAGTPAAGASGVTAGTAAGMAAAGMAGAVAGAAGAAGARAGAGASGMAAASGAPAIAGASGATAGTTAMAGSGGAAGASGTSAPDCTGKPGMLRGKRQQTVMIEGVRRSYIYYAPEKLDANKPAPLLIVPHGYTQSGEDMFAITKYPELADREGFVALFPDGGPSGTGPWDVGSGVCGAGAAVPGADNDQAFVDAMIEFATKDQCIDREHIFMSGWSMGGYFSHETACTRNEIRAIGPHSAGTHDLSACKGEKKPVIMFHFNPDGLINYSCGQEARDSWVARNGCQIAGPDVTMVKGGQCEHYKGCAPGAQVAFCTFDIPANHRTDFLAGHAWSGGTARSYSIAETESAAELAWKFFKTYAW